MQSPNDKKWYATLAQTDSGPSSPYALIPRFDLESKSVMRATCVN
ncbi:hypothetical protein CA54_09090 [Symmachiella macrocystis]|uniref:Uncharacterized protein n=1 Tax=Symmachiella macrocystis TaxID=2527985 RepID=A0A5C6BKP4_9PLAN|nr:hypothetical protein CA54_09090 [Symmachiella macrocystis]